VKPHDNGIDLRLVLPAGSKRTAAVIAAYTISDDSADESESDLDEHDAKETSDSDYECENDIAEESEHCLPDDSEGAPGCSPGQEEDDASSREPVAAELQPVVASTLAPDAAVAMAEEEPCGSFAFDVRCSDTGAEATSFPAWPPTLVQTRDDASLARTRAREDDNADAVAPDAVKAWTAQDAGAEVTSSLPLAPLLTGNASPAPQQRKRARDDGDTDAVTPAAATTAAATAAAAEAAAAAAEDASGAIEASLLHDSQDAAEEAMERKAERDAVLAAVAEMGEKKARLARKWKEAKEEMLRVQALAQAAPELPELRGRYERRKLVADKLVTSYKEQRDALSRLVQTAAYASADYQAAAEAHTKAHARYIAYREAH
jgi:hypothetical protein